MIDLTNEPALYEKLIHYNEAKHEKIYLSVNTFRGTEYLSLRKYFQDFDEEWVSLGSMAIFNGFGSPISAVEASQSYTCTSVGILRIRKRLAGHRTVVTTAPIAWGSESVVDDLTQLVPYHRRQSRTGN